MNDIRLQLDLFEGPLDLLLYLIKKHDLEISRVSIAEITDQYLLYLDGLKELDVDVASDFLYMAAELAYIKSRSLVPDDGSEDEGEDDVAGDLVARLKEYERYKMAAQGLKNRIWLNRDVFARGAFIEGDDVGSVEGEANIEKKSELYDVDSFELIKAFYEIMNRLPKAGAHHQVTADKISVTERIYEILERLKVRDNILFSELFQDINTRAAIVVSFLAILEMTRLKLIRVYQTDIFSVIRIQRCLEMTDQVLSRDGGAEIQEDYR